MFKIFVGNIHPRSSQIRLRQMFEKHGHVDEVIVPMDEKSGRSRGYAFILMPNEIEGMAAVQAINGALLDGRSLVVNPGQSKSARRASKRAKRVAQTGTHRRNMFRARGALRSGRPMR